MTKILLAVLACWAVLAPAQARADAPADQAIVSHVEAHDGTVDVLVTVPAGASVDLAGVGLTIGGKETEAAATIAGSANAPAVRRTTVLAIDTSDSMKGKRFAAATAAAKAYLAAIPADVEVGIVSFDKSVHTDLAPTTDRVKAAQVVDSLTLAHGTALYDGVTAAVTALGAEGQRTVLLLSDGRNTNGTPLASATQAVHDGSVQFDAVALDQKAGQLGALRALVAAGKGQLVPADAAALDQAFRDEAAVLTRQVLVSAQVPASVTGTEADLEVTLPVAGRSPLVASTYTVVRKAAPTARSTAVALTKATTSVQLPRTAMYGGLAAIGLGLLVLMTAVLTSAGGGASTRSIEQRIAAYGPGAVLHKVQDARESTFNLAQAKDAAASMLHRNKGLEARIELRLEAAGSALKPAEWLLLHGAIALLSALVGLLLGGGSILLLVLGLLAGAALPWWWLGFKQRRRVATFNAGLADTLQLISGSLSAGMSLAQAMDAVVEEGNEPIAGEFKRVLIEARLGVPLEAALEGVAQRIESLDFAWAVMAIRIQREVGGNLAELLTTVAETLRERDYLRRQVKTLSAEGRLSAYILIMLPIGMFLFMLTSRRAYLEPLYTTGIGMIMLAACGLLLGLGWLMMSRIVKVEV